MFHQNNAREEPTKYLQIAKNKVIYELCPEKIAVKYKQNKDVFII